MSYTWSWFRYGVLRVSLPDEAKARLVFITWCPDTATPRLKMLYAGSKEPLKRVLVGVDCYWQVSCWMSKGNSVIVFTAGF